jgi:class 3 adenylate cyclase
LIILLVSSLAITLYRKYGYVSKTNIIISEERDKSDNLLKNILPDETAQELKQSGAVQAKRFESVTVMFTDFKGFTSYAEHMSPEELVESVDFYFSAFDKIIEKHGLEKIKTVGDAYMCAGGLPFPTDDHPIKAIQAAKEIIEFVRKSKIGNVKRAPFDVRVGINTGPVVAGVVGTKKFAYDIWGDTVNIASRMESNSEIGKINVSGNTYELIKDQYQCEYRGNIPVKNRGNMDMYFVGEEVAALAS